MANQVKILFDVDSSEWHGLSQETLWADLISIKGRRASLRLQNSPFFARNVSFLDLVEGEKLKGGDFHFRKILERSGHSTYIILCPVERTDFDEWWAPLGVAGCTYESGGIHISMGSMKMFSVDIPPGRDVSLIFSLLQMGEDKGVWIFQESHYCRSGLQ